jgi:protein TonB
MMNNAQLAAASLDDIVFDGRNKGYGAYELRALYQRNVSRALAIGTTVFALLVMFPVVAKYLEKPVPVVIPRGVIADPITYVEPEVIVTPPPPTPPPATRTAPPPAATIKDTEFRVTRDAEATDKVPDVDDLSTKVPSTKTTEGPDIVPGTIPDDLPADPGPATVAEEAPHVGPYISVQQMPELPGGGGVAAIVAAIQKAVRYPSRAISAGVEGRVYVSFVVNAEGEVVDIKVLKGLGSGLDEETMRAIKTLPRFIPGKQNGREVSVSYSVPITFKIQ